MLNLLRHCWAMLTGGSRWQAASVAFDLSALALLDLVQLVCLHRIVDGLGGSIVAPVAGLIAAALASGWWLRHLLWRTHRVFAAFTVDYTEDVLRRLRGMDLLAFEALDRSEVTSTLRIDLEQFRRFAHGFVEVLRGLLVGAVYLGYVMAISPRAALVIYGWLFAMGAAGVMWATRWRASARRVYAARDAFVRLAYSVFDGAREIGLHRQRSDGLWATIEAGDRAFREAELGALHEQAVNNARGSLTAPGLLGVIAFVVPAIAVGGSAEAPGLLAIGLFSLRYVQLVLRGANATLIAQPIHERLQQLLARLPEPTPRPASAPPTFEGALTLRDVAFSYPSRSGVPGFDLGPVDLDLRPGRVHFVVGHNGSGKSTLLKGLCGLYPLADGEVRVDGVAVRTTDAGYRALFAVSFAQPIVHRRLYGLDPDPARVEALLASMGLAEKVRYADGAFDTVDLSTGQRKRLDLVLCLLQDRPVLVLDEWAADQDPGFRAHFYRTLLPRLRAEGKALVVISHDDQYFDAADSTLALADGRMRA